MLYGNLIGTHEKLDYSRGFFYFVKHTFYDEDSFIVNHWHRSIEIMYVIKGEKTQIVDGQKITAKQGDLILLNSGHIEDVNVKFPFEGIILLIDRQSIETLCPQCINKKFNLDLDKSARENIIDYLFLLIKHYEDDNKLKCHITVLKIIDVLVNHLMEEGVYINDQNADDGFLLVMRIIEYLENHYMSHINLDDIANMTNYNKTYLSTMFKKRTGITIFQYLNNIRMEHVLEALKYTDDNIVHIALNNGFANIQVFNRKFKSYYHMTPKEYRRQVKNAK